MWRGQLFYEPHEFLDPDHLPRPQLAQLLGERIGYRAAPIRRCFLRRAPDQEAYLAQLVRGGRGGLVRLNLLLSILWLGVQEPHDVAMPARTWATLLRVPDPEKRGARRIREAISWLHQRGYLETERLPGRATRLSPYDECERWRPYKSPIADSATAAFPERDHYLKLSASYWTNGWIGALSGPGTAVLLTMLDLEPIDPNQTSFWISPHRAKTLYGLSESTRRRGIADLRRQGLLEIKKIPAVTSTGEVRTWRNAFTIDHGRLRGQPLPPARPRRTSEVGSSA